VLQFEVQLLAGESEDVFLHPALHSTVAGVTGAHVSSGKISVLLLPRAAPRWTCRSRWIERSRGSMLTTVSLACRWDYAGKPAEASVEGGG